MRKPRFEQNRIPTSMADRHPTRLYCTCAHSGEVLLLDWQARRRYSSRIDRQKGMIHEQCHITCHGCEIAIGIVALDTSIATGLFFIALPPKGKRYFAVSSSSAAISNNAYLLSRTLFELLLSNKCFSSIFEITGWFVSCDDFKRVYHLPLNIMKRKNNFIRNKYVNFELIF